jgi:hypothetical protein
MKLKLYLNEEENNIEEIYKILNKDCKKYLNYVKKANNDAFKSFLFRGVDFGKVSSSQNYKKIKSKKISRKPRYINTELHEILNKLLYEKFGWKPRTEGIFTGNYYIAQSFAKAKCFMFAPVGNFQYIWRKHIYVLYDYYSDIYYSNYSSDFFIKELKKELDKYSDENLHEAFNKHEMECIVKCDYYYLVSLSFLRDLHKKIVG